MDSNPASNGVEDENTQGNRVPPSFRKMTVPGGAGENGSFGFYGVIQRMTDVGDGCWELTIAVLGTNSVLKLVIPWREDIANSEANIVEGEYARYYVGCQISFHGLPWPPKAPSIPNLPLHSEGVPK